MEMLPFLISCSLNYRKRCAATHPFPKVNALQSSWPRLSMATVGVVWRLAKRKKNQHHPKELFFPFSLGWWERSQTKRAMKKAPKFWLTILRRESMCGVGFFADVAGYFIPFLYCLIIWTCRWRVTRWGRVWVEKKPSLRARYRPWAYVIVLDRVKRRCVSNDGCPQAFVLYTLAKQWKSCISCITDEQSYGR